MQVAAGSFADWGDALAAGAAWFWETDADGRVTWMSDSVEDATGAPAAAYRGRSIPEMTGQDLGTEPWKSQLERMARREPFRNFRFLRKGPAREQWVSATGVPVFGPDGAFRG